MEIITIEKLKEEVPVLRLDHIGEYFWVDHCYLKKVFPMNLYNPW